MQGGTSLWGPLQTLADPVLRGSAEGREPRLSLLRKFCSNYPEHWPKYLDILNFSYNNSTSPQTGYSPHMVILGRHLELPLWLHPQCSSGGAGVTAV